MSATAEQPHGIRPGGRFRVWHRNPMRGRGRVLHESFLVLLLLAVLALPALGVLIGRAQFNAAEAHNHALATRSHPVTAVLQQNVYGIGASLHGTAANVTWTAADGTLRAGTANVGSPGSQGETTTIWLDPAGDPTAPPAEHSALVVNAVTAAVLVCLGGAGVLLVLFALENNLFMRSRMRAWARDWERTAPTWTRAG
ncbi:Rv1733c family protein [Yinghuangia seranimata]|uniref:Rv1733c family protein n=1 Tax=Yinghuangia seranimata TaxID=408067 RepID=UPI00248C7BA0|nr:hypothetical protein [Yinghuangia seranimata]MDI2124791.1 hypothetical protein [Yinghuangia seranimata]